MARRVAEPNRLEVSPAQRPSARESPPSKKLRSQITMREHPSRAVLRRRLISLGAGLALLLPSIAVVTPAVDPCQQRAHGAGADAARGPHFDPAVQSAATTFSCQTDRLDRPRLTPRAATARSQIQEAYGIEQAPGQGRYRQGPDDRHRGRLRQPVHPGATCRSSTRTFGAADPVLNGHRRCRAPHRSTSPTLTSSGGRSEISLDVQYVPRGRPGGHDRPGRSARPTPTPTSSPRPSTPSITTLATSSPRASARARVASTPRSTRPSTRCSPLRHPQGHHRPDRLVRR